MCDEDTPGTPRHTWSEQTTQNSPTGPVSSPGRSLQPGGEPFPVLLPHMQNCPVACLGLNEVSHTKASDEQLHWHTVSPQGIPVHREPKESLLQRVLFKKTTTPLMKINLKLQDKQNANTQVRRKQGNDWGQEGPNRPSQDQWPTICSASLRG